MSPPDSHRDAGLVAALILVNLSHLANVNFGLNYTFYCGSDLRNLNAHQEAVFHVYFMQILIGPVDSSKVMFSEASICLGKSEATQQNALSLLNQLRLM